MISVYTRDPMDKEVKEALEDIQSIKNAVIEHHKWFERSLPMIASENLISPLAREMLISDFHNRYAEGHPGARYYQGCRYIDEVESTCEALARKLFKARYADVRPISGTVANIGVFFALAKPGDAITAVSVSSGGHISHASFGAAGVCGQRIHTYPFDENTMSIDIDGSVRLIRDVKPKIVLVGQSVFLFPTPLKELRAAADDVDASVVYDGAHVLGLIAGGAFQDPLREGADVITASTHKTLPGPQGGLILSDAADQKLQKKLDKGMFPGVLSNHHLHHMAAKAITFAESLAFGKAYAEQIVKNAKAFAREAHELGFNVLCEQRDFTESHQILLDVRDVGGGKYVAEHLEKANIIVNKNLLPSDDNTKSRDPSGIRIGIQELTRLGMKESDIKYVAELYKKLLIDKKPPSLIQNEVAEFRKDFKFCAFCFNTSVEAFKYYDLFDTRQ